MNHLIVPIVIAIVLLLFLVRWYRANAKTREDREQIDRKLKEDALDRALSNGRYGNRRFQAQTPVEIHYSSHAKKDKSAMFRLTEQAESVTKEYLFSRSEMVYIGEEYGRAAVFQQRGGGILYCELFPHQSDIYVRLCGKAECRLLRGRQTAPLTEKAIRLRTGDRIETQTGVFLVEFI